MRKDDTDKINEHLYKANIDLQDKNELLNFDIENMKNRIEYVCKIIDGLEINKKTAEHLKAVLRGEEDYDL